MSRMPVTRREGLVTRIRGLKLLLKACTDPALRRTTRETLRRLTVELDKLDAPPRR